jgi:hypothetical protein
MAQARQPNAYSSGQWTWFVAVAVKGNPKITANHFFYTELSAVLANFPRQTSVKYVVD